LKYRHIACGGTFDFFHAGHRAFLKKAFFLSEHVSIGITSDHFARTFGKWPSNRFSARKSVVEKFLNTEDLSGRFSIIRLDDIFGSTIVDKTLQGIFVTENTINGALKINAERRYSGLDHLDITRCELKKADDGIPISSTRIKTGKISLEGENYFKFLKNHSFVLPKNLRPTLAKPFGSLVEKISVVDTANLLVTVGDQTTCDSLKVGIVPNVSVIDYYVQRIKTFQAFADLGFDPAIEVFNAKNPQGFISKNLSEILEKSLHYKSKSVVIVDGEEDLAVLPVVLLAPLGTNVYYGLRGRGLVKIVVDIDCKNSFWNLLKKFTRR